MGKKLKNLPTSSSTHYVTSVTLTGVEKRLKPNKHYVFILEVEWSDNNAHVIYRSYSDFYDFHITLMDIFPIDAGLIKQSDRILPYLPGRRLFRRNEVEKVAKKRQVTLGDYCRDLLQLEHRISSCPLMLDFFSASESDINPPKDAREQANTKNKSKSEAVRHESFKSYTEELQLEKSKRRSSLPNLVYPDSPEEGATCNSDSGPSKSSPKSPSKLKSKFKKKSSKNSEKPSVSCQQEETGSDDEFSISSPIDMEEYRAITDYDAVERSEVSLKTGDLVDVIEKRENGWWFCEVGTQHGWTPASYLEPVHQQLEPDEPEPNFDGNVKYITTCSYNAQLEDEVTFPTGAVVDVLHKLLDGWWIVCYLGEVGHAPAAYLQPYNNPLAKTTPITQTVRQKASRFRPIPRRCTIKNSESKWKGQRQRDMSVYREKSVKKKENYLQPVPKPRKIQNEEPPYYHNRKFANKSMGQAVQPAEVIQRTQVQNSSILTPIQNHRQEEFESDYEEVPDDLAHTYIPMTPKSEDIPSSDENDYYDYVNVRRPGEIMSDEDGWEIPPQRSPEATRSTPVLPPRAGRQIMTGKPQVPFVKLPQKQRKNGSDQEHETGDMVPMATKGSGAVLNKKEVQSVPQFSQSPTSKHVTKKSEIPPPFPKLKNTLHNSAVNELKEKLAKQLMKIDSEESSPSGSSRAGSPVIPRSSDNHRHQPGQSKAKTPANRSPPKPPVKPKKHS